MTKILIIYTGGTIGMIKDSDTGQLSNVNFEHIYDHVPELKRLNVELGTKSFTHPIDSSEISIYHWQSLAEMIKENYVDYDGFVVLHGSDTMAYTSSALSFMFCGLKKPIILTGSQLPIGIIRTDGKENLITAIEIAATKDENNEPLIQEVAVYFDYQLFRGNRSTKDSAENFEAFRSPNYHSLANAGVNIKFENAYSFRTEKENLSVRTTINQKIGHLKLYPGINFELYKDLFDREKIDGIVLESFGSGNAPSSVLFKGLLKNFIEDGGIVLNITQCNSGSVKQGLYKTSSMFNEVGVISGGNMTTEAAVTKMMVILDPKDLEKSKMELAKDIRGEVDY